jgi:hypothetical protein
MPPAQQQHPRKPCNSTHENMVLMLYGVLLRRFDIKCSRSVVIAPILPFFGAARSPH